MDFGLLLDHRGPNLVLIGNKYRVRGSSVLLRRKKS
jgi:hypothetical protein